jgi:hypothetical protein
MVTSIGRNVAVVQGDVRKLKGTARAAPNPSS